MAEPTIVFDHKLPHGRCLGLALPEGDAALSLATLLVPEERAFAEKLAPRRRRTWIGGRAALRLALEREGLGAEPILATDRGAPKLPAGIAASLSHKDTVAVALIARDSSATRGVDVELETRNTGIARHVLRPEEMEALRSLSEDEMAAEVLLRFSAKESIYKAIDPYVQRYVTFHEATLVPEPNGTCTVTMHLTKNEGPFSIEVHWRREQGLVITTSRISLAAAA